MPGLLQDFAYGWRLPRRDPGFTAIAILCLTLGIGANSAIFSLADAIILRPLPVPRPREVVTVRGDDRDRPDLGVSYRDYADLRDQSQSFSGLAAFSSIRLGFSADPRTAAQMKLALAVSGNFFRTLEVEPDIGRGFRPEEDQTPGRDAVAVISRALFEEQFHSDPSAIGGTVRLNGIEFTVGGVAPERFTGLDQFTRPVIFVPIQMRPRLAGSPNLDLLEKRDVRAFEVKGRLKPGIGMATAQSELATISSNLERAFPESHRNYVFRVRTELQNRVGRSDADARLIAMPTGLAGLVLIIACANVANLLLSRARARAREMAVRLAIGAGRGRIVRQLFTESLLLALAGGAAGLLVAQTGVDFLAGIQVPADPPVALGTRLDQRVLFYTLIASFLSSILFGLLPALQSTRTNLVQALKAGDTEFGAGRKLVGRNLLVVGQVALSLLPLVAASMFILDFRSMLASGLGCRTDHLAMMSFDPTLARYTPEQTRQFYRTLLERARLAPGVGRVALASVIPTGMTQSPVNIVPEGFQLPPGSESVGVLSAVVTDDYFETLKIPILSGRGFRNTDTGTAPRVAVVNEELGKRYWPNQDPVGKRFRLGDRSGPGVEVVGVTRTGKYAFIAETPRRFLYLPFAQGPKTRMTLLAESRGDAAELAAPLRELVRSIDAGLPVFDVRTMEDFYRKRSIQIPSSIVGMVAVMGLLGTVLA